MPNRSILSRLAAVVVLLALLLTTGVAAPAAANERPEQQAVSQGTEVPEPDTVTAYGSAVDHGPSKSTSFASPLVDVASVPDGRGYWLVAADGGVFTFGSARFHGSTGAIDLAQPIVGIAAHPSGDGYWLVAADGGVFTFGAARFHGSMGGQKLNQPIVGMAPTASGNGYWLVASDGGIFAFGDATFRGSTGDIELAQPIVGMARVPTGVGYWMVAADGGLFSFGDARFFGSEGGKDLPHPIVGMAASPDGKGYWLAGRNGQVYPHGVTDHGNAAEHDRAAEAPTVGIAAQGPDGYVLAHGEAPPKQDEGGQRSTEALQRRLAELGYWIGPIDGTYGELTTQAVYAFQKYEGLAVDGVVGPNTRAALDAAQRPVARTRSGNTIEVDKTRQLLFFVRDGRTEWVFNTSTGTEEPYTYEGEQYLADTPPGRWDIYRQIDGYRTSNLGRLYRPKYFHTDGIAIHGYTRVPPYPASHGCVRVTNQAIDFIWANGLAPIGADVWVYGQTPRT